MTDPKTLTGHTVGCFPSPGRRTARASPAGPGTSTSSSGTREHRSMAMKPSEHKFNDCVSEGCNLRHGDECPECGGCVVWSESNKYNGYILQCDECGSIFTDFTRGW